MQAVIMAGGEGSRLRPLTIDVPKPILPVANRPLMEHIIELLRRHGFVDVTATVQFAADELAGRYAAMVEKVVNRRDRGDIMTCRQINRRRETSKRERRKGDRHPG